MQYGRDRILRLVMRTTEMTAQHEIDRLARMSPETLRAALIVAETRRVRIKRAAWQDMSEGERTMTADELHREAMERASAKFLIALRSKRCRSTELAGNWEHQRQRAIHDSEPRYPGQLAKRLADAEAVRERVVKRDPCGHCGVRGDIHAAHGCGRYAG